jgi:DNA-binding transcriptional MocR family regulator
VDQDLSWWAEVVFAGWRDRPGPRYARLAAALLEAVDQGTVARGTRVPAERALAAVAGASRGTVVACYGQLVEAGVLSRRQGSGTYVAGRPSWAARPAAGTAAMLLRRIAEDRETIDLSVSAPGDLRHLPPADPAAAWHGLDGHGLDPAGLPALRAAVARHLTEHQGLPTEPGQVVITAGAQEALWLLSRVLPGGRLLASCPGYPGLAGAIAGTRAELVHLRSDAAGEDPSAVERAGRSPGGVAFLMPTGHNPTGTVMPLLRRQSLAAIADAGRVTIVEDLTLADLTLGVPGAAVPPPLAALSTRVIAVGSVSKVLWGGLRVGWIRAAEPLRSALIARKSALSIGTAVISQALAAQLLAGVDARWLAGHRAALTGRRDLLAALLTRHLPGWRTRAPQAGLSLWAELPTASADAYAATAARTGVSVLAGSAACSDGRHENFVRLSFAEQPGTLELAVERLAVAWELHAETLAVSPARG